MQVRKHEARPRPIDRAPPRGLRVEHEVVPGAEQSVDLAGFQHANARDGGLRQGPVGRFDAERDHIDVE